MINIAVCDDEAYMTDMLAERASQFFSSKGAEHITDKFLSGIAMLDSPREYDIIFLDIKMEPSDGMETARLLRQRGFDGYLIFVTILRESVFDSFEFSPFDYIVKPVEPQRLADVLERLYNSLERGKNGRVLIRREQDRIMINTDDVIFAEVIDRKLYIHLKNGNTVEFYGRLEELSAQLDGSFFRCHRSYILNLKYVKSYDKAAALTADGSSVPISRLRHGDFEKALMSYMENYR